MLTYYSEYLFDEKLIDVIMNMDNAGVTLEVIGSRPFDTVQLPGPTRPLRFGLYNFWYSTIGWNDIKIQ